VVYIGAGGVSVRQQLVVTCGVMAFKPLMDGVVKEGINPGI
jgi:hypothetical protein